jgi:glycosyltransferase involved in cell wall biosynthesis
LLFLFLSHNEFSRLAGQGLDELGLSYEPSLLFFGRLEAYKGVENLLTAYSQISSESPVNYQLILAGPGDLSKIWAGNLPPNVELRNGLIADAEALDLFLRCSLVLLPYIDATQSGLIASAYYFQKPVLVSRSGALPEYVKDGETGFIVEPGHPSTLARALSAAISDSEHLRHLGRAGRRWYDEKRVVEEEDLQALYASFETL